MDPELLEREVHLQLQALPIEILLDIFLHVTIFDTGRLCQTSTFFAALCSDDSFWKARVTQDRPELRTVTSVLG
jgi:hypothetical protein